MKFGVTIVTALVLSLPAAQAGSRVFLPSAVETSVNTVRMPLHRGMSNGQAVYFVVFDASTSNAADRWRSNRANKLANAAGTQAVQRVRTVGRTLHFPFSVDFRPARFVQVSGGAPVAFQAGSRGEGGYTPLAQLADGSVINAPHVARDHNGDGVIELGTEAHDKVVSIDTNAGWVVLQETEGFANDERVFYVSTEASVELAAALEGATLTPALQSAPGLGDDSSASSRSTLALFLNGQTGGSNPERQGLASALAGEGDPLNVIAWTPNQGRYSPLWDVFPAEWSAQRVSNGTNTRQRDIDDVLDLADSRAVTGPGGARFGPGDFVVNCPVVSQR